LLFSNVARADERTEARGHFKKGMSAIAEGHYEVGIDELKAAYDILPHPNVLYNIARAYVDMGDLENAVVYYRKYLEGAPKDRDEVAQIVASLEARIRKQQATLLEAEQQTGGGPQPAGGPGPGAVPKPGTGLGPGAPGAAPLAPGGEAAGEKGGGTLKTEEVFEETVVTASKIAQSPLDAPNSTSIITAQDIRLSGITKIPELLRRLAGVDVMEVTGGQQEVSLRGFNQRLSNKILVLIDGRSIYTDLLGATIWRTIPVGIEDIERIEVVRGPGSALYGADAFNGVVNIITKAPGDGGSGFRADYGQRNASLGEVWASGRDKELSYRFSGGYEYLPRWSHEVPPGRVDLHYFTNDQDVSSSGVQFGGDIRRRFGNDVTAGIAGGYEYGTIEILGVGPYNDIVIVGNNTQSALWVNSKNVETRVFWNHSDGVNGVNAAVIGQNLSPALFVNNTVDGEVQYIGRFQTGPADHDLHIGWEYRLKDETWSYQGAHQTEHHVGLFLHDEVKIGAQFAVVGDYRADYVPYLKRIVQSPRGSVLFHPTAKSTIRGIIATAFRTPTFLESYLGYQIQLPATGAALESPTLRIVQPEPIITTELGYLNSESDYFTFDSALFYNHVTDLLQVDPNRKFTVADLATYTNSLGPNPSTGLYPLFTNNAFINQCQRYNVYGAELGVRTFPFEGLDVYGNYTLMDVAQDNSACSQEQKALLTNDARTSPHKVNAGVQLRTRFGIDGEVDFHYVSPQDWAEQVTDVQRQQIVFQSFNLNAYTLLNARVGYRFLRNHAELSATAFNLLGYEHREHPFGQLVGRQIMGIFTYKF
jgi:iron complex outermembrane receptor protein